jgi:phospholipase/carboxylesterase
MTRLVARRAILARLAAGAAAGTLSPWLVAQTTQVHGIRSADALAANPHLRMPLSLYGAALQAARVAAILFHGRAQTPELMSELIVRRIGLPGVAWYAPAAAGSTWYPQRFIEPLERNEPMLGHALERVAMLSDDLAALGFTYTSQVLVGFSQGACLASEYLWRSRWRYGGLVAFTGGLIGPPGLPRDRGHRDLQGTPVLLSTWDADPFVPQAQVRDTARRLSAVGAQVMLKVEPGTEHTVRAAGIGYARELLTRVAAA